MNECYGQYVCFVVMNIDDDVLDTGYQMKTCCALDNKHAFVLISFDSYPGLLSPHS